MLPIVLFFKKTNKQTSIQGYASRKSRPGERMGNAKEIAWLTLLAVIHIAAASQSFIRQTSDSAMSRYDDLSPLFNSTFPLCCSHALDGNWCSLLSKTWLGRKRFKAFRVLFQSLNATAHSRNQNAKNWNRMQMRLSLCRLRAGQWVSPFSGCS